LFFGPDEIAVPAFKPLDGITYVARLKDGSLQARRQPLRLGGPKDLMGHGMPTDHLKDLF
jgi:hypothetical protein